MNLFLLTYFPSQNVIQATGMPPKVAVAIARDVFPLAVAHQAYDGYLRSSAEHSLDSSYSSDIICIVKLSVWPEA